MILKIPALILISFSLARPALADAFYDEIKRLSEKIYVSGAVGAKSFERPAWQFGAKSDNTFLLDYQKDAVAPVADMKAGLLLAEEAWGLRRPRLEFTGSFSSFTQRQGKTLSSSDTTNFLTPHGDGTTDGVVTLGTEIHTVLEHRFHEASFDVLGKSDIILGPMVTFSPFAGFSYRRSVESYDLNANVPVFNTTSKNDEDLTTHYLGAKIGSELQWRVMESLDLFAEGFAALYRADSQFESSEESNSGIFRVSDELDKTTYSLGLKGGLRWHLGGGWSAAGEGGMEYLDYVPQVFHNTLPFTPGMPFGIQEADAMNWFAQGRVEVDF